MAALDQDAIGIYLNDHLAVSAASVDLARRTAKGISRRHDTLHRLADEIAEDRAALQRIMQSLGVQERRYKQYGARLVEKIGRLKFNGRLFSRSPVSDALELEALRIAVDGKAAGWRLLRRLAEFDERLDTELLDRLVARAEAQTQLLEELRMETALDVFSSRSGR